jgi:hypothetical protein
MTASAEEASQKVDSIPSQANPQMPGPASPIPPPKDLARMKELEFVGLKAGLPSWDDIIGTPHFRIGIVIDSSSTYDRHITAIPKPATPCSLVSMVVLHEKEGENRKYSMKRWFTIHRMEADEPNVQVLWGQEGFKELLASDIDAVYIIVPPG